MKTRHNARQPACDAFGRSMSQRYSISETRRSENASRMFSAGFDTEVLTTTMAYDVPDCNRRTLNTTRLE